MKFFQIFLIIICGAVLIYGVADFPSLGDPQAPANNYIIKKYLEKSYSETGAENVVTAVLAHYRGYDTLGETTVIFTAGISVILLLRRKKNER